ncbi:MAG: STAS domain-containing protein [bacterium]|nr:STAS domain-containing protein [bacterium]
MQISHTETEQGVVVIAVSGRVMLGTESQKIETTLEQFISKGRRKFVFDLSGVKYIDSTGIGRFISGLNKVMQAGGKLRMAGAQGIVREGFRVTRLDTVFEFFDDLDKACQGMG